MDTVVVILFGALALVGGLFLGTGNYGSLLGVIVPGLLAGFVASFHFMNRTNWKLCVLLFAIGLVGSIGAYLLPDGNWIKRLGREQKSLVIHLGSYKLGKQD